MTQMSLPLYNPQDRGRLNALQNILLVVSDELRQLLIPLIFGIWFKCPIDPKSFKISEA